ncbi:acyl-CoA dehydrogenase family protein [Sphingomonas bisphenolicum]
MTAQIATLGETTDPAIRAVEAAKSFVPRIKELARKMELDRRVDSDLIMDMDAAGLFSVVQPRMWGGAGLGPRELSDVLEVLGGADCSTAWIAAFYNVHNSWLARFPRETQQQLYGNGDSVRCAATFAPPGMAERVDGGYRITGRWPYCSGIWDATHVMLTCIVDGDLGSFIVRKEDVELIDDWHMASMSATGSISVAIKDHFVADGWWMPINRIMSADQHEGTFHPEATSRYPATVFALSNPSIYLGALLDAVEAGRERLLTSRPQGHQRIHHPGARMRWAEVYEAAQVMRFLRDGAINEIIARADSGRPLTPADAARQGMHDLALVHGIKDAFRKLVDGSGSSVYKSDDRVRRAQGDVAVYATHALGPDYDVHIDRHARAILGYEEQVSTDPTVRVS